MSIKIFLKKTGAQVSILSEACATRCNIYRLVDTRFQHTAMGVGGSEKFLGRIHSCKIFIKFYLRFFLNLYFRSSSG